MKPWKTRSTMINTSWTEQLKYSQSNEGNRHEGSL